MAEGDVHPGLNALVNSNTQVKISIRNHLGDIADYLRKKDIIDLALYNEVTNPKSLQTDDYRAALVYRRLQAMVEGDETYYHIFMEYLRKNPKKFKEIISMLDRAYAENGGRVSGNPNPNPLEPIPQGILIISVIFIVVRYEKVSYTTSCCLDKTFHTVKAIFLNSVSYLENWCSLFLNVLH